MKIYRIGATNAFIRGENSESLTKATGEAGWGYYFSPVTNLGMSEYYTKDSRHVWMAYPKSGCHIEDLTSEYHINGIIEVIKKNVSKLKKEMKYYVVPEVNRSNYQRFPYSVEDYIKTIPNTDAYLIKHSGPGIPSGKQLIIVNLDAFDLEQIR